MKLTTQQIAKIDETLVYCGIIYDDIKLELIDHIASEVEVEMQTNQTTFSEAFNNVFDRWKIDFKRTRAFFSLNTFYPKIARNKFSNQVKLELISIIAISSLLFISFQLLPNSASRLNFVFWIKKMFFYSYFVAVILMLALKFLNKKTTISSTYKHMFDARFPAIIVWLSIALNDSLPNDITNQNLFVLTIGLFFMYLFSTIYLGFKHFQFQRKFLIRL